ncbi:synapse differentiation-inducing gene protein 1 [Coregonus clupeaformis]|uniref:synapse differentiation-inducing gene protein 1 n=1 Tax=Coregonus clupeaformis TaxID=59861 RepID=UPI001BDFF21E|nr:synapse differentiation-inducing gene protein 1 [Coregonus clupeaformis]
MESLDELEHPLLGRESPKADPRGLGNTCTPNRLRCEEDQTLPPLGWRGYCGGPGEPGPGALRHQQAQQLLDPCSLPNTLETMYPPAPLWGRPDPDTLGLGNKDYLETTFVDIHPESPMERKLLAESQQDAHSVFYSLEDEDELLPNYEDSSSDEDFSDTDSDSNFPLMIPQDYLGLAFFSMLCCFWPLGIAAFYLSQKTNKASAQGDFQGAGAASRQALWLSVLSMVFGIITYICAISALISYLSGKPP